MRARLCKRLDNVEMQHKYFAPRFNIDENDAKITLWRQLVVNDDNMEMVVQRRAIALTRSNSRCEHTYVSDKRVYIQEQTSRSLH